MLYFHNYINRNNIFLLILIGFKIYHPLTKAILSWYCLRQSGDLKVLGELYQRYMDLVYGVCLKYLKDPELAQDAVMQIFEELVSKLKKHEVENFRGWLHQVAKNYCLMQLRTPKNLKTVALPPLLMQNEEDVHLNGVMEKEENFQKLEKCIASLPDEQRTMIKLFYLDGKCYNEIVEITGWNGIMYAAPFKMAGEI